MNAPMFPLNPAVGQFWNNWVWNGARWVCSPAAGVRVVTQVFQASGPYMPSQGLVSAVVECVGGGGGGGGAIASVVTAFGGGGGGGSAGYSRKTLAASLVAGGVQVTVGVGGTGAGSQTGNPGTATSFGALCVSNGGPPGEVNSSVLFWGDPGAGAAAGIGDLAVAGNTGFPGTSASGTVTGTALNTFGGAGGTGPFGGGSGTELCPAGSALPGLPSRGPGGGGAGGTINQEVGGVPGGTGGPGICIVTEYCWADTGTSEDCCADLNVTARVEGRSGGWSGGPYVDHRGGEFGDD